LWLGALFVTSMSYYTSDYMRRAQEGSQRVERYVYDPTRGEYVPVTSLHDFHVV
jgi:hypothetical protein